MRLCTFKEGGVERAGLKLDDVVVSIADINQVTGEKFALDLFEMVSLGQVVALERLMASLAGPTRQHLVSLGHPLDDLAFGPLYRHPRKIWGIGLNYKEHAGDLAAIHPTDEPASFMKADTTIIGPGDFIILPEQSDRVTAEAELGIVIGQVCKNVTEENALDYVAGYTTILDMTAEDILQKNPRFLTRSKNFDSFFSFGPELITPAEVEDVLSLEVRTVTNGTTHRSNTVAQMTFPPAFLVAFHSRVMTLLPGDIISTGTPGAVMIRAGDVVSCDITGFHRLTNPVRE